MARIWNKEGATKEETTSMKVGASQTMKEKRRKKGIVFLPAVSVTSGLLHSVSKFLAAVVIIHHLHSHAIFQQVILFPHMFGVVDLNTVLLSF